MASVCTVGHVPVGLLRCTVIQVKYMPKKPTKWGLKASVLADSSSGYTHTWRLYMLVWTDHSLEILNLQIHENCTCTCKFKFFTSVCCDRLHSVSFTPTLQPGSSPFLSLKTHSLPLGRSTVVEEDGEDSIIIFSFQKYFVS